MSGKVEVAVTPKSFELAAGDTAEATATLRNLGQSVDQLTLNVEMLDPEWYSLPVSSVALFPNDQDNLKIMLHPPKDAEVKSGTCPFRIRVISQDNPKEETTVDLAIEIQGVPGIEMDISPQNITGWRGVYNIQIDNPSDVEAKVQLSASDARGKLRYHLQPESLSVASGGRENVVLAVRLGWLSFLGGAKEFDFQVRASVIGAVEAKTIDAQLIRVASYKYLPKVRVPWLIRRPNIHTFEVTTTDQRDFKLSWFVKRATEVKLGDEIIESKGEKLVSPTEATSYVLTANNKHGISNQTVNVEPLPAPKARTSERIRTSLSPTSIEVAAGGIPVQATLELQNLGDIVDKFVVEVEGIDESWYSRSASSIALMPQATDQVVISFQPPKKKGVRAKAYPFAVAAKSQNSPEEVTSILGSMEVLPLVEYKLGVRPYRVTTRRKGKYRINLTNNSVSDANVSLEATDLDEGLNLRIKEENPIVPSWNSIEIPMVVKPKKGSIMGERRRFDITLTSTDATGNSQTVNCEMSQNPPIRSWRSVFRFIKVIIFIALMGTLIGFLIHWGGG
ncbi:hypothetical protein ACFLUY_02870, partial [Chloroflexota bacterium]